MLKIGLAIVISATIGVVPTVDAKSPWKNSEQWNTPDNGNNHVSIDIRFSDYDKKVIHQYYKYGKNKTLPPGLAKKKRLPPGLQKQIARNGKLPPGIQGRYLPYELERNLGRIPRDSVRIRIGSDILLVDIPGNVILDVIKGVVFN